MNKSADPDHFYYNIIMTHDTENYGYKSSPAKYQVEQVVPILDDPSKYYISIVRFSVDGQTIPITTFRDDMTVTLLYNTTFNGQGVPSGTSYTSNVVYVPTYAIPNPLDVGYNFIYSYQDLVAMFNTALEASYTALETAHPGTLDFAPFFTYNSTSQLFSLITPYTNIENGFVTVWVNVPLFENYIGVGFNSYKNTFGSTYPYLNANGLDFQIVTNAMPGNTNGYALPGTTLTSPPSSLIFTQEFVSITEMNAFKNIIFATGSIPIVTEQLPQQNSVLQSNNTGTLNLFPVLTDFEPVLQAAGNSRQQLQYFPQGPYRYVDMISNIPLRRIDMSIFWQDKNNNLYPHNIAVGQVCTIKLLFRKKESLSKDEKKYIIR